MSDKYLHLAKELNKTMGYEGDTGTFCNSCTWNNHGNLQEKCVGIENE